MSVQNKPEFIQDSVSEESVVDYLQANPDLFTRHEELLLMLELPHHTGDAVSLLQYQVERLREQNTTTRSKLIGLVNVARENDKLSERIHQLTLALIDTASMTDVINVIEDHAYREFTANYARIYLFNDAVTAENLREGVLIERNNELKQQFEHFFKANRPLCGRLKQAQLDILFQDHAGKIGSSVLLPLGSHSQLGMLAIGSHDETRFSSSMGTVYLNQMAQLITRIIQRHLSPND